MWPIVQQRRLKYCLALIAPAATRAVMICPWDAGSLQRPSKAPKARHCYCLWGRPRSLLLRHFRLFWPFASLPLLLSHSYCPSLTFCAWRKVIWWEGVGRSKSGQTGKKWWNRGKQSDKYHYPPMATIHFASCHTHACMIVFAHTGCLFYCSALKMFECQLTW